MRRDIGYLINSKIIGLLELGWVDGIGENRYYIPFSRSQSFPESSKKALISCLSDATNKVLYKIFVPDVIDGLECIELGFEKATREGRRTDTDARSSTECGMCGETLLSEDPNLL